MTAGAAAMFVVVGGSAAGVATIFADGAEGGPENVTVAQPDLGAPYLEEDPEVVSRAAAAAQPLPRRQGDMPPPVKKVQKPPVKAKPRVKVYTTSDRLTRERVADDKADRTGPRPARKTVTVTRPKTAVVTRAEPVARGPVVTTRTDVVIRAVPFETEVVKDGTMLRGTRRVEADGEAGEETLRYLVTLTDGRPTARRLLSRAVTVEPENRVVAVGSRRQSVVDPFCEPVLGLCLPFGRSME